MDERKDARKASREDVARVAGVAPSTVSLVLNGWADRVRIPASTCARVEAAARELHYLPNAAARSLRRGQSRAIGLLLGAAPADFHAPVFEDLAIAAVGRAYELERFVLLLPSFAGHDDALLASVRDADVAGVICNAAQPSRGVGEALARTRLPVVWIEREPEAAAAPAPPAVRMDHAEAFRQLTRYLNDQGRSVLGVIAGPSGPTFPSGSRYRVLLEGFRGRTFPAFAASWSSDAGYLAGSELLRRQPAVDAIFAANDMLAAGVLRACRESGVRVPEDVAVIGYGDFVFSRDLEPPLTTIRWPLREIARRAVEKLVGQLVDPVAEVGEIEVVDASLVRRRSA